MDCVHRRVCKYREVKSGFVIDTSEQASSAAIKRIKLAICKECRHYAKGRPVGSTGNGQ